ncbi:MAG TPA: alpha/beta hydrolase [Thermoanaerobaculia bacterium]|jgi:acetyl esterase/lipase|nr:alpha/beta hydrolase [Thermoanaerobaculia bacterium]
MKRALAAVALLLLATSAFAGNPPTPGTGTFTTIEALEFANVDGKPLLLDLRIPDGPGPFPLIVYLHSGAWISGDRSGGPAIRQAARGYAVASIDYRLAPQYVWPAQLEDCKAAVRWLRAHAAQYRLDPARVGVFGTSSGGHLAAMLATTNGRPEFEGAYLGNPDQSSSVKAVVDLYGPTDLLKLDDQKLPCIPLDGNAPFMPPSLLMGCPIQQCKEKTATASPLNYVTRDTPPFLILHGLLDCLVPWQQSQLLDDALEAQGVDSTLVYLLTAGHADHQFDDPKYKQMVSDFLDAKLRGPLPQKRRAAR